MTTGNKSGQSGGTVPLHGESMIRQQSTAADVLTIQFSSGSPSGDSAGRGLVVRTFVPMEGSKDPVSSASEVFAVDYTGAMRLVSSAEVTCTAGITVPRQKVSAFAAASAWGSTVLALSASHAGQILTVALASAAGGVITLPKASGVALGTEYKICTVSSFTDSGLRISSSLSSSNDMVLSGATGKSIQCSKDTLYNFVTIRKVGSSAGLYRWGVYPAWSTAFNNWSCTGVVAA